ncbi:MAG: SLC13 family permease [Candidatus Sumerlaeia bacterium]
MTATILVVFGFVYLGMILGEIPGLALDRAGVALLGAIVLAVSGVITPEEAWRAIDVPTMGLLFGLMIVSAQFRLGGFYTRVTERLVSAEYTPAVLLALLIVVVGVLSALLANDIVCLAMTPILAEGCARRRLNPMPFLLALACAANVGSAATLIGNPQNMLIGQALGLSFSRYLWQAGVPAFGGLLLVWVVVCRRYSGRWHADSPAIQTTHVPFNRWQTGKASAVIVLLMAAFLFSPVPREVLALGAAGILLLSRRMASREILKLVDWNLLVLFMGLFIVNHALRQSGLLERGMGAVIGAGLNLNHPGVLFLVSTVLSNIVSNVPAVMLLLPAAGHPLAGPALALSSTLAGNLLIVGSIANIIVADQAAALGVRITWAEHLKTGVPVTILTLLVAGAWLWACSGS